MMTEVHHLHHQSQCQRNQSLMKTSQVINHQSKAHGELEFTRSLKELPSQFEELEDADDPQSQRQRSTRVRKPNPKYVNATLIEDDMPKEPSSYQEASREKEWIKVVREEIDALAQNQIWDLVPKLRDVQPISCKWVYKIKTHPDGSIDRYKA
ncbi:hypothetical protein Dimus_039446 [Dionaea muscipula]